MGTLLLIDGHSQAYRAYFGLKTPLSTRHGEPTTAVFGFTRKLLSTLKEHRPDYVTVAFDVGDTWRHVEFRDYKATRERMPDDMSIQMDRILQILRAFNIPVLALDGHEADDVIGSLACRAAEEGHDVLIMTGDRDMFQLVDERVRILYTSGGPNPSTHVVGPDEVRARYSIEPNQFVDFKALVGDSSDNIPGVPGVGEKTAIKLIQQFGSIDALYENLDAVSSPKQRQALLDARKNVYRNRRLCKITCDLPPIAFDPQAARVQDYVPGDVIALFNDLEFRSLLKELPENDASRAAARAQTQVLLAAEKAAEQGLSPAEGAQMTLFAFDNDEATATRPGVEVITLPPPSGLGPYPTVQDRAALDKLVEALQAAPSVSFDVETTSQHVMAARLVGLGVAWGAGQAAYIPVGHVTGEQLPWDEVRAALQPVFADAHKPKLAHNANYDLTVLLEHGMEFGGPIHDTMVLAWLLDPASRILGLKAQAGAELGWNMTEITELIGTGKKQITIDQVPIEAVATYCGADVDATIQLYPKLAARVHVSGMWPIYEQIELPLVPVISSMERAGVLLDVGFLQEMSGRLSKSLAELELELYQLVGHEFNLRSTQQMSVVLFNELGFPTRGIPRTSSGHHSTAVLELEKLRAAADQLSEKQARVLELIFQQRQLEKLRGTYVDALPLLVNERTGRVHTSFNQAGAVTGRMSSSEPNLQNIPIRTEIGREIRRAFVAPPGWLFLSADYSQIELRILAHVTGEPAFVEAFNADADIHAATAARLFGVPLEEITKAQRGLGKTINFATIYGSSAFGISSRTDLDPKQAQEFLDQYFKTYPRIRQYIDDTTAQANREGVVQTLLGRKRFFPELVNARLPLNQRMALERQAINAPIQGSAADIMKLAMVRMHDDLKRHGLQARMLLQVHDELVFEFPPEEQDALKELVCDVMINVYKLDVPLKVDVEIGPNWYDLQPA